MYFDTLPYMNTFVDTTAIDTTGLYHFKKGEKPLHFIIYNPRPK